MPRMLAALALLLGLAPIARAQDMPLSQILIEGEGWKKKKVEGKEKKLPKANIVYEGKSGMEYTVRENGKLVALSGIDMKPPYFEFAMTPEGRVNCLALSSDRTTLFAGGRTASDVWAFQVGRGENDVLELRAAEFCKLRLKRGGSGIEVTGLSLDTDGRLYAATEIGVQVFDPSGRLCGVMTPAAPGRPESMWFEGDQLTLWIGDVKYTRKLNAVGAK